MATPECQAKIDRFFSNVDRMIAEYTPAAAEAKLAELEKEWIARLGEFRHIAESGRPMPAKYEGADAVDFHVTIAGLAERRTKLKVPA